MAGDRVKVSAAPGGYLISTRTGGRHVATDLGAVWDHIADVNSSSRVEPLMPQLSGVITIPKSRPALTQVLLVVDNEEQGGLRLDVPKAIDCRMLDSTQLWEQLRRIVDRRKPAQLQVLVRPEAIERRPVELRAHPSRPFAVIDIQPLEIMRPRLPNLETRPEYLGKIPSLLSWLAAVDGVDNKSELRMQVALSKSHNLAIDMVSGIVTRCEMSTFRTCDRISGSP